MICLFSRNSWTPLASRSLPRNRFTISAGTELLPFTQHPHRLCQSNSILLGSVSTASGPALCLTAHLYLAAIVGCVQLDTCSDRHVVMKTQWLFAVPFYTCLHPCNKLYCIKLFLSSQFREILFVVLENRNHINFNFQGLGTSWE